MRMRTSVPAISMVIALLTISSPLASARPGQPQTERFFLKDLYHLHDPPPKEPPGTIVMDAFAVVGRLNGPADDDRMVREMEDAFGDALARPSGSPSFASGFASYGRLDLLPMIAPESLIQKYRGGFKVGNTTLYVSGSLKFKLSDHDGTRTWLTLKPSLKSIKIGWGIDK